MQRSKSYNGTKMWKDQSDWQRNWYSCVSLTLGAIARQSGGRMTPAEGKSRSGVHGFHRGRSLHQSGWQPATACIPHSSHASDWDLAQLNNKRLPEEELYVEKSVSSAAPHGPPLCPDVHVEFSVFDFTALGNLNWTTEQWGDDVHMNFTPPKKSAAFFITLGSVWICRLPVAGECRPVYLALLWFEDLM